jgi:hypothetical protein
MMRACRLLLILGVGVVLTPAVLAQGYLFPGAYIKGLAHTIVTAAKDSNRLPDAYQLPDTTGHSQIIYAAHTCELLAGAIVEWHRTGTCPSTVPLNADLIRGPQPENLKEYEPVRDGLTHAIACSDIYELAPQFLIILQDMKKLPYRLTLGSSKQVQYTLTPAQFIVAMATVIDDAIQQAPVTLPTLIEVPLVRSPFFWLDPTQMDYLKSPIHIDPFTDEFQQIDPLTSLTVDVPRGAPAPPTNAHDPRTPSTSLDPPDPAARLVVSGYLIPKPTAQTAQAPDNVLRLAPPLQHFDSDAVRPDLALVPSPDNGTSIARRDDHLLAPWFAWMPDPDLSTGEASTGQPSPTPLSQPGLPLAAPPAPLPAASVDVSVTVQVDGVDLTAAGGSDLPRLVCGTVRVDVAVSGGLAVGTITLDYSPPYLFTDTGEHMVILNTLGLSDGTHTITATAIDTHGKVATRVCAFTVRNGRETTRSTRATSGLD